MFRNGKNYLPLGQNSDEQGSNLAFW